MANKGNIFRIYCYTHLIENIEPTKWNTMNTSKDNGHKIQIQLYWDMFMEYIDRFPYSPAATTLATVERAQTFGPVACAPMS